MRSEMGRDDFFGIRITVKSGKLKLCDSLFAVTAALPFRVVGAVLGVFGLLSGSPVAVLASHSRKRRRR